NPIWFHCASLGEFEQGRPLLEALKAADPECPLVLSFYSPSGYEIRKDYPVADYVCYLPIDTPRNARRFLDILQPSAVFIVKYEFWFNLMKEMERRKIPAYLVSGVFRGDQIFFRWYGAWFRKKLKAFSRFYVQDQASANLLASIGYTNTLVSGDTRFDRVLEIATQQTENEIVRAFCANHRVLMAGSSWEPDETILAGLEWKAAGYKLILTPHETDAEHIAGSIALFTGKGTIVLYSQATGADLAAADILIVDRIGLLSSLYRYGTLAMIGGGFGDGIHNILEPAVMGLPVIFGPDHEKFPEAAELIAGGGAFCIHDTAEMQDVFGKLAGNPELLQKASVAASSYVQGKSGAVASIMKDLKSK
ncbi:MAG TPA: glycosyltransferase N-terminal domain-containing protein, partial [Bacteroidia bacterium]|nr:glycosyltransferase N-terminal domain-containing protein [Bacteroidia bacterium]